MRRIKSEILQFLIPVILITYALGAYAIFKGGMSEFPIAGWSMLVPALTVIVLYIIWKKKLLKGNDLGINFKGMKYWLIAPLTIFFIVSLTYFISYLFNENLFLSKHAISNTLQNASINKGGQPLINLGLIFILNVLIAPIINFPMFLGEELGWRGFLTPRLLRIMRPISAFVVAGIIWALWHAFGIFMGLNYPGHPVMGNLMMILFCIPMGVILQYFYFKSSSIFPVMMAHGALNWTSTTTMDFFANTRAFDTFLFGPTGIVGILTMWLFATFFYHKMSIERLLPKIKKELQS